MPVSDQHTVDAALTGDQVAWDALVGRFTGTLWSAVRAYGLSPADAADADRTNAQAKSAEMDRMLHR